MSDIKRFIDDNAVDEGFLSDWYQASVTDDPPVWTDEHIREVCGDFYLLPKSAVDNTENSCKNNGEVHELRAYQEIGTVDELKAAMKYVRLAKQHGTIASVVDSCAAYEEIGTVEEFRTAKLKQLPKPLDFDGANWYRCPNGCEIHKRTFEREWYCPSCGQRLATQPKAKGQERNGVKCMDKWIDGNIPTDTGIVMAIKNGEQKRFWKNKRYQSRQNIINI